MQGRRSLISVWAFALSGAMAILPSVGVAETLSILRGDGARAIMISVGDMLPVSTPFSLVEVSSANPNTADARPMSRHEIEIVGREVGRTSVLAIDAARGISIAEVLVRSGSNQDAPAFPAVAEVTQIAVQDNVALASVWIAEKGAIVIGTDDPITGFALSDNSVAYGVMLWGADDENTTPAAQIYLLGMQEGSTTLTLLRDDNATQIQIDVLPNMTGIE